MVMLSLSGSVSTDPFCSKQALGRGELWLFTPLALVLSWCSCRKVGLSPPKEAQLSPSLLFSCWKPSFHFLLSCKPPVSQSFVSNIVWRFISDRVQAGDHPGTWSFAERSGLRGGPGLWLRGCGITHGVPLWRWGSSFFSTVRLGTADFQALPALLMPTSIYIRRTGKSQQSPGTMTHL